MVFWNTHTQSTSVALVLFCYGATAFAQGTDATQVAKDKGSATSTLKASEAQEDDGFSILLGIGSLITGPNASNYMVKSNSVLEVSNVGRATPQLMTGLSFPLPFDKPQKWRAGSSNPWSAFVSLKFTPGSTDAVDGFVVGATYRISKYLDLLAGYSLSPIHEISPGFQAAAVAAVNATAKTIPNPYGNFNVNALAQNSANAYDGFPLTNPGSSGQLYPGDPLTTHYPAVLS